MQQVLNGHTDRKRAQPSAGDAEIPPERRAAGTAALTVTLSRAQGMQPKDGHDYTKFRRSPEQASAGELPSREGSCEATYPSSSRSSPCPATLMPQQGSANDEAHYITTHEIQLCEADQEPDYPDFGLAPSTWSDPVDSAPCGFLEYASFDSQGGTPTDEEDCSYYLSTASDPNPTDSLGSTELVSTYSEGDTSPASSGSGNSTGIRAPGEGTGQILLSIKTASKAIKEPSNPESKHNSAPADAKHEPDMSYCLSTSTGSKALQQHHYLHPQAAADAHRLVAIPARLQARSGVHADISSGASSAVSELDDADKEVRSLTSRAFRSLAYPYFEAINFSSSESTTSLSDQNIGLNSWSTYLDWKGGSFLSQKAEKTLHQQSATTSNFGVKNVGKDAGKEQQVYVQANKSETKAFELVVSEVAEKGANPACSSKRSIQSGSRVVTLTETFSSSSSSSNVKAGGERANKPAGTDHAPASAGTDHAPASAGTEGVTETAPRERAARSLELSRQSSLAEGAMEGTHKSKYASSLLKNIISKKMKLEQEFRMERGQLSDTSHKTQPKEGEGAKGLQRQNSKFSETGSDLTLVSSEDIGEFFESKSTIPKDLASLDKRLSPFESHREESICEMKKTASETMKGIFLRSQNSAFRSWKEKEIEKMEKKIEENVAKARRIKIPLERDWRAELGEISSVQATKMSRLYVPGIQHTPKEKQVQKQATKYSVSTYAHQTCFSRNENEIRSEKLHILEASVSRITPRMTPKPQEIKLRLGLATENKDNPFNIAKLLTPNLAASAASLSKAAEDLRSQVPSRTEVLEKMPQFLVRDVREAKPKVQGAIHQVRDVRKLLKSSYSHDTGEGSDRGSVMSDHSGTDNKPKLSSGPKSSSSLSPIVITYQAVKNKEEGGIESPPDQAQDIGLSPAETLLVHRASGRLPVATIAPNKTGPRIPVVKIVSKASRWRQEKPKEPEVVVKPEPKVPEVVMKPEPKCPQSKAALEKLTAAVKTMEQLYVFDRREWKRKDDPQPVKGSHVLSMIACHEAAVEPKPEITRKASVPLLSKAPEPQVRRPGVDRSPSKPLQSTETRAPPQKNTETRALPLQSTETRAPPRTFQVSRFTEAKKRETTPPSSRAGPVNVFSVNAKSRQQSLEATLNTRNTRPQPPTSLKIPDLEEPKKPDLQPPSLVRKASADFENYLTIPVKVAADGKPPVNSREPPQGNRENPGNAKEATGSTKDSTVQSARDTGGSSIIREAAAAVRDSAALCTLPPFSTKAGSPIKAPREWSSKAKEGVQPTRAASATSDPPTPDSVPPATIYHHPMPPMAMAMPSAQGPIYYSPPVTSATQVEMYPQTQRKMLVDLATGQYYLVDTPVQPVKRRLFDPETGQFVDVPVPPPPVTPVPIPMPQLALSPGAYGGHAYMFYPGFLPSAPTAVLSQNSLQTQLSNPGSELSYEMPVVEGSQPGDLGMDSPYYLATGSSATNSAIGQAANIRRGSLGYPDGKQVISMLSQPGPRIVAPPSFDGTTMRFVVEHR